MRLEDGIVRNEISQADAHCTAAAASITQSVSHSAQNSATRARMGPYVGPTGRNWSGSNCLEPFCTLKARDKLRGAHRGNLATPVKLTDA